jgi:hypothetical protein
MSEVLERIAELKRKGNAWLEDEIARTDAEYRRIGREQDVVGCAHFEALVARYWDDPAEWNREVGFPLRDVQEPSQ